MTNYYRTLSGVVLVVMIFLTLGCSSGIDSNSVDETGLKFMSEGTSLDGVISLSPGESITFSATYKNITMDIASCSSTYGTTASTINTCTYTAPSVMPSVSKITKSTQNLSDSIVVRISDSNPSLTGTLLVNIVFNEEVTGPILKFISGAEKININSTGTTGVIPSSFEIVFPEDMNDSSVTTPGNITLVCGNLTPTISVTKADSEKTYTVNVSNPALYGYMDCTLIITTNVKSASNTSMQSAVSYVFKNACSVNDAFNVDTLGISSFVAASFFGVPGYEATGNCWKYIGFTDVNPYTVDIQNKVLKVNQSYTLTDPNNGLYKEFDATNLEVTAKITKFDVTPGVIVNESEDQAACRLYFFALDGSFEQTYGTALRVERRYDWAVSCDGEDGNVECAIPEGGARYLKVVKTGTSFITYTGTDENDISTELDSTTIEGFPSNYQVALICSAMGAKLDADIASITFDSAGTSPGTQYYIEPSLGVDACGVAIGGSEDWANEFSCPDAVPDEGPPFEYTWLKGALTEELGFSDAMVECIARQTHTNVGGNCITYDMLLASTCCGYDASVFEDGGGGSCNNNGTCEDGETFESCPADCLDSPFNYGNAYDAVAENSRIMIAAAMEAAQGHGNVKVFVAQDSGAGLDGVSWSSKNGDTDAIIDLAAESGWTGSVGIIRIELTSAENGYVYALINIGHWVVEGVTYETQFYLTKIKDNGGVPSIIKTIRVAPDLTELNNETLGVFALPNTNNVYISASNGYALSSRPYFIKCVASEDPSSLISCDSPLLLSETSSVVSDVAAYLADSDVEQSNIHIYMAGDGVSQSDAADEAIVWQSADGGNTWSKTTLKGLSGSAMMSSILLRPTDGTYNGLQVDLIAVQGDWSSYLIWQKTSANGGVDWDVNGAPNQLMGAVTGTTYESDLDIARNGNRIGMTYVSTSGSDPEKVFFGVSCTLDGPVSCDEFFEYGDAQKYVIPGRIIYDPHSGHWIVFAHESHSETRHMWSTDFSTWH